MQLYPDQYHPFKQLTWWVSKWSEVDVNVGILFSEDTGFAAELGLRTGILCLPLDHVLTIKVLDQQRILAL